MRPDIVPGAVFPGLRPPDENGRAAPLSELQGDGQPHGVAPSAAVSHCPREPPDATATC